MELARLLLCQKLRGVNSKLSGRKVEGQIICPEERAFRSRDGGELLGYGSQREPQQLAFVNDVEFRPGFVNPHRMTIENQMRDGE